MRIIAASLACTTLLLAGCGGGGGAASSPSSVTPVVPTLSGKATAQVSIVIPPKAASAARGVKPAYVSPSTQSITVQVDSATPTIQNLSPTSPNCTNAGAAYPIDCTVPVSATAGAHTVTFNTFDQPNAAGSSLSTNSIPVTFVAGQNPTIPVALAGVPHSFYAAPLGAALFMGSLTAGFGFVPGSQSILIAALDADGNFIVGPGAPALAATVSGATAGSGIAISAASASNPNQFTLTATGFGNATLALSATPASSLAGSPLTANAALVTGPGITTLAGSTIAGFADGTGASASFSYPSFLAYDSANGNLYVTDPNNNEIRQVTPAGAVTTLAGSTTPGSADGTGTSASFSSPQGIAYDSVNGDLYVTDTGNCNVRQVTTAGAVVTIAGGLSGRHSCGSLDATGTSARFSYPAGIAYDGANGDLYVTDWNNCEIRQVTTAGVVTTIAGSTSCGSADGTGTSARFYSPVGIAYDSANGDLYVTDLGNCEIRQITPAWVVTTVAGSTHCGSADGIGASASFSNPSGIVYDSANGDLYVTDTNSSIIRQVTTAGAVTTIAGEANSTLGFADGIGANARFSYPAGIEYDPANGLLYITDSNNNAIREMQL